MTDAQLETTTEVHYLHRYDLPWNPDQLELIPVGPPGPAQTVTFTIWSGSGVDFKHNPCPDWDEAEVAWTGDSCPPFEEDYVDDVWGAPDSVDADRTSAREMYADLIKAGYVRQLA